MRAPPDARSLTRRDRRTPSRAPGSSPFPREGRRDGGFPVAAALSPTETAGQLVCVPLRDYRGDPGARGVPALVRSTRLGRGHRFGGDLAAPSTFLRKRERSPIPPLVTGDFERGLGQQFPGGGTRFPSYMAFGAAADPAWRGAVDRDRTRAGRPRLPRRFRAGRRPGDRAGEPDRGRPRGERRPRARGGHRRGDGRRAPVRRRRATVKHFPGHGRTNVDSHEALPVVEAAFGDLDATD